MPKKFIHNTDGKHFKPDHPRSQDCGNCIKDQKGRSTGLEYIKQDCKHCKGTGKRKGVPCEGCFEGSFLIKSKSKPCGNCRGTGKDGNRTLGSLHDCLDGLNITFAKKVKENPWNKKPAKRKTRQRVYKNDNKVKKKQDTKSNTTSPSQRPCEV